MSRISFPKGEQTKWINKLLVDNNISVKDLSKLAGVCSRTLRDWRREKFTISEKAFLLINQQFHLNKPSNISLLNNYWYVLKGVKKGALRRLALYGPLGTLEGRKKGGRTSQLKRKLYLEKYKNCDIAKTFVFPKKSINLAELTGIVLGDGGITSSQLKITLNKETESEYIEYVCKLLHLLFKEKPGKFFYGGKQIKVCNICLNGVNLIKFLAKIGLKPGNKVKNQVCVPFWIIDKRVYYIPCLRGLVDTDGSVYSHRHTTKGFKCFNYGLTFGNHSQPLLDFAYKVLLKEGFTPKRTKFGVYLYRQEEVKRYFDIIGTHSEHHLRSLNRVLKENN